MFSLERSFFLIDAICHFQMSLAVATAICRPRAQGVPSKNWEGREGKDKATRLPMYAIQTTCLSCHRTYTRFISGQFTLVWATSMVFQLNRFSCPSHAGTCNINFLTRLPMSFTPITVSLLRLLLFFIVLSRSSDQCNHHILQLVFRCYKLDFTVSRQSYRLCWFVSSNCQIKRRRGYCSNHWDACSHWWPETADQLFTECPGLERTWLRSIFGHWYSLQNAR